MKKFHGSVFCLALAIGILSDSYFLPEQFSISSLTDQTETGRMQEPEYTSINHTLWLRYQKINPDLKAVLVFENGLLSLPVVQTHDNTTYLKTGFNGLYDRKGTPFLDCRDCLSDPAFLIYGHLVYYDSTKSFSPLEKLENQDAYEKNQTFFLVTDKEIRTYEIISVFRIVIQDHSFDQRKSFFHDQNDFENWIGYAEKHNEIQTWKQAEITDRFCLLQTCVRENDNERLIVLARQKYR